VIDVDISAVLALEVEANGSLTRQQQTALEHLQAVAEAERGDHAYQNRTHRLEDHTQAIEVLRSSDGIAVDLAADMPYAKYVEARGLMRIDERAGEAARELESYFESERDALGG
jgi:hypothetical protein